MTDKEIIKVSDYEYKIKKKGNMNVPVKIFANKKIMDAIKNDKSIQQGINVSSLPGICSASIMMPDAHQGYGFSIGGVAGIDYNNGCISPGGIGFDINCGVRLLSINIKKEDVEKKIDELLEKIFEYVPCGVGKESDIRLSDEETDEVLKKGARWAVENGYGNEDDLVHCEENGAMKGADPSKITPRAKARGRKQLGTLGAGNHFLEIQFIDEIYDEETSKNFNLKKTGDVTAMIHCGSRGLGHQVCSDYIKRMEETYPDLIEKLPEKDLVYAPSGSDIFNDYLSAMAAAANFAWTNRHIIAHNVRKAFKEVFNLKDEDIKTVYDVAHNIAKIEEHHVSGKKKKLIVHRKGATRAFPKGHEDIPEVYKDYGQPVLIPGSMGTSSYVLVGTEESMKISFGSTAHGAGRVMSRFKAIKSFNAEKIKDDLAKNNIHLKARSLKGISEEAPQVYKDVDEVVKVSDKAGLAKLVARLKPIGVIKG
ncbi:MAG: RtcB family protein [Candidatus Woesearchaeota archaeon]